MYALYLKPLTWPYLFDRSEIKCLRDRDDLYLYADGLQPLALFMKFETRLLGLVLDKGNSYKPSLGIT